MMYRGRRSLKRASLVIGVAHVGSSGISRPGAGMVAVMLVRAQGGVHRGPGGRLGVGDCQRMGGHRVRAVVLKSVCLHHLHHRLRRLQI